MKILLLIFLNISLYGHSLILNSLDNEDGTMEIIGKFSTGASAEGGMVKIVSNASQQIIYEKRIPAEGSINVKVPNEAYTIILDSGPGHKVQKEGDIIPSSGFTKVVYKHINYAFYTTLGLSLFFLLGSVFIQFRRYKRAI